MCPEFLEFILEHDGQFIDRLGEASGFAHGPSPRWQIEN